LLFWKKKKKKNFHHRKSAASGKHPHDLGLMRVHSEKKH